MDCIAYQAPLSMEFPKQEYWSGLPYPLRGSSRARDRTVSLVSPALAGKFFTRVTWETPYLLIYRYRLLIYLPLIEVLLF